MQGYPITFNIYANDEREASDARLAIVEFIRINATEGRAVSARAILDAIRKWNTNGLVRTTVNNFLSE